MILCFSGRPRFFPGLPQLWCTSPLRVSSWQSTPLTPAIGTPKFEHPAPNSAPSTPNSAPSPHLLLACKLRLGWKVLFGSHLCGEFSPFCFPSTCCYVLWWGSEAPPECSLPGEDVQVFGNFSSFMTGAQVPVSKSFVSLFFFFLNLYLFSTSFWGDWLAFWKSGVFCKGSEGVL